MSVDLIALLQLNPSQGAETILSLDCWRSAAFDISPSSFEEHWIHLEILRRM